MKPIQCNLAAAIICWAALAVAPQAPAQTPPGLNLQLYAGLSITGAVGTGHGEWIRKGRDEFASTTFLLRSGPTVDFTGLVKVTSTFKLNRNSDQITSAGTVYIYDAAGNLLFSFPVPGSRIYNRVTAGQ